MSPTDLNPYFARIVEEGDTDLYLFRAQISTYNADLLVDAIRFRDNKRPNCTLILTTTGGQPDAGYRMARAIKRHYPGKFTLLVYGMCKSTGTLIALGADEIAMGDFAELGPLDIQLTKEDELFATSGLNYDKSLAVIRQEAIQYFYDHFTTLKRESGLNLTTRTAAEVATKLAVGLLAPITSQLDPVRLGEVRRAVAIAADYGSRLCDNKQRVDRLITGYSSHTFVIDLREATDVFGDIVRPLNEAERELESVFIGGVRHENEPVVLDIIRDFLQVTPTQDDQNNAPNVYDEPSVTNQPPSDHEPAA